MPELANPHTNKTVTVFGAYPNDIEIGMAGTICRLKDSSDHAYACSVSIPDERALCIQEAKEAARWNEGSHQDHVNVPRCIIAATRKAKSRR